MKCDQIPSSLLMSRQKEREDLFEDPFDSPLRYNHPQFGPSNGLCSPCHYIRSSIRSKSIFLKKSPQNQQNNTTKKTKVNKSYINDFDGQIQIQQYIFSNNNKSKSIHESLSSLFKENKIDARYEEPKEESSLVNYLQAIQQLMQELESNVGNLERKLNLNQQRIQEPIIQCNNHQLVYINQNVQGLVGRIQYILMQKNLLPDRPQPNPDENQIQLNFNRDLKKYKCQFCPLRFIKACSLGYQFNIHCFYCIQDIYYFIFDCILKEVIYRESIKKNLNNQNPLYQQRKINIQKKRRKISPNEMIKRFDCQFIYILNLNLMDYQKLFNVIPKEPRRWTQCDVESWLEFIGLQDLSDVFQRNAIDGACLEVLNDDDLNELGINSNVKKKKILQWIQNGFIEYKQFVRDNVGQSEWSIASKQIINKENLDYTPIQRLNDFKPRRDTLNNLIISQLQTDQVQFLRQSQS